MKGKSVRGEMNPSIRQLKNRESAKKSRERKNALIRQLMEENAQLKMKLEYYEKNQKSFFDFDTELRTNLSLYV